MRRNRSALVAPLAMGLWVFGTLALVAGCATPVVPMTQATPATPLATPNLPPQAVPTPVPAETPTQTPWLGPLPAGTIALYGAGSPKRLDLYALGTDGAATGLGVRLAPGSLASHDGRWVVHLDAPEPQARAVVIRNLEDGRQYTIPLGVDCPQENCIVGLWAFDREGTRLASVEVALDRWAAVVADLRDGSSRRFEATRAQGGAYPMPPGTPLGWAATGELILDTFRPFSEGAYAGVWAINLPAGGSPADIAALAPRQLVAAGAYLSRPQLSPDGTRLLYLARDREYMPAGYTLHGGLEDVAVNQLWSLDLVSGQAARLVEVTDGGALASAAAWSPDGGEALFAQGRYADGQRLSELTLKAVSAAGAMREIGPLPVRSQLRELRWCTPGLALATTYGSSGVGDLLSVDLVSGRTTFVVKGQQVSVLGVPEAAGPVPTPDFRAAEAFTVYTSTSTSPDGLWTAQAVSALPVVNGQSTGDSYYARLAVARADGAVAWTLVDEWSIWALGYTTPEPLHWSRDGRYLYFTNLLVADGCPYFVNGYDLQRLDLQDGRVTEVAPGLGLWLALSPDERTLAVAGSERLVLRDLTTGQQREVRLATAEVYGPVGKTVWAPDGSALMLTLASNPCASPEVTHSILRVDAMTLAVQTLLDRDRRLFTTEAWPEAGRVLLADKDKGQWWLDPSTGELARAE